MSVKKVTLYTEDGDSFEVAFPCVREVCWRCDGEGKHVNPSVDGDGIGAEEFDEDDEFRENYFAGVYDVTCEECDGRNVVDVIDGERAEREMPEEWANYCAMLDAEAYNRAESAAERRMGA